MLDLECDYFKGHEIPSTISDERQSAQAVAGQVEHAGVLVELQLLGSVHLSTTPRQRNHSGWCSPDDPGPPSDWF